MKKLAAVVALTFLALEGAGSYALAAHRGSIRGSTRIRREIEIRDNDAVRLQREAIAAREQGSAGGATVGRSRCGAVCRRGAEARRRPRRPWDGLGFVQWRAAVHRCARARRARR